MPTREGKPTGKEKVGTDAQLVDIMAQVAPEGPTLKRLEAGLKSVTKEAPVPHMLGMLVVDHKPISVQYEASVTTSNIGELLKVWKTPKYFKALQPLADEGHSVEFYVAIIGKVDATVGTFFLMAEGTERLWGPLKPTPEDTPEPEASKKKTTPPKSTAAPKKNGKDNGNGKKDSPPKKPPANKRASSKVSKPAADAEAPKTARKPAKPPTKDKTVTASRQRQRRKA
jgi:hypothetical protein